MSTDDVKAYLLGLQNRIVAKLESIDGGTFLHDEWQRDEGLAGSDNAA